jgi:myosin heavy subunit
MGFLDKNRDEIRDDIMSVLHSSSNTFLKEILPEVEVAVVTQGAAKAKKRMTLASHFKNQLFDLMSLLDQTLPAYVRCIKPNPEKLPRKFANKDVLGQMNCNNILETVRLRQQGWASRRKFDFFYSKNWILDPSLGHPARMKGANHQVTFAACGCPSQDRSSSDLHCRNCVPSSCLPNPCRCPTASGGWAKRRFF